MANKRVVVDPITRIEATLRIQATLDENNKIIDAMSTGPLWRGVELILKGRDPRDAWAFLERVCGVCTGIHAVAGNRAVEDALGIKIPKNANILRNLMNATLFIRDHIFHFYQLDSLDWVDIISALKADPKKTSELQISISRHPKSSPGYFKEVQNRLKKFVESGQLGIFAHAYWGHPAYQLSPEANLLATTHYLEALDVQREIVKISTILGGKNPHPNYMLGGVPCPINMEGKGQGVMINQVWINYMKDIAERTRTFIEQVYYPDVLTMASFYPEWFKTGGGLSSKFLLCYGDFPKDANDMSEKSLLFPNGAIVDGKLDEVLPVDLKDPEQIQEYVDHSWYLYPEAYQGRHPWDGITEPHFELGPDSEGTKTNIKWLGNEGRYSWVKAPRWRGHAMETGPLARCVVAYAKKMPIQVELIREILKKLDIPFPALFSTLGRIVARVVEDRMLVDDMIISLNELEANIRAGDEVAANMEKWDPSTWPKECRGAGQAEAPRGALGHWVVIKDGKIDRWQAVVPSTWNASPRDPMGQRGAYESALLGTSVAIPGQPLEILRTVHSFDPCMACATHLLTTDNQEFLKVTVR